MSLQSYEQELQLAKLCLVESYLFGIQMGSWYGTATMWMVPAGTMGTSASIGYGVWSTVLGW